MTTSPAPKKLVFQNSPEPDQLKFSGSSLAHYNSILQQSLQLLRKGELVAAQ
jgi:hypothetical protein